MATEPEFELPGRVDSYLATLNRLYERNNESLLREIIVNGGVSIHEGWDYDNWDGGTYGHAVTLTLPEDIFLRAIDSKEEFESRIAEGLNKLNRVQNEHVSRVFIEMQTTAQDKWREETGVYRPPVPAHSIPADALQRIWDGYHVRVFLSHKATVKVQASRLKQSFARCGIGAFVAHEDIEPTQEWQREIERALFSMDALVALLTQDYHESNWTDQEVGVAIGRGVPLIAVRLGSDPYGLMGKGQGLGGCSWSNTDDIALKVLQLLFKRLSDRSRLFECVLAAYASATSFADSAWKVEHLLAKLHDLSEEQVDRVLKAYRANGQNRSSFRGMDLLQPLLKRWTGREWTVRHNELTLAQPTDEDTEIPF
ncbi:MAG TPA: toll/interleukin-1 receptor domain-containing protein [Pirellulales bacterium]|nr:toll/interleukin-1 receptor domain-containing protein [Pirellulales bacterium]